jgi:hypothetical protein
VSCRAALKRRRLRRLVGFWHRLAKRRHATNDVEGVHLALSNARTMAYVVRCASERPARDAAVYVDTTRSGCNDHPIGCRHAVRS